MRIKKDHFENRIKETLGQKPKPSSDFEAALFAKAEDLLSTRRELLAAREAEARNSALSRRRWLVSVRQTFSRLVEIIAIHPDRPATAAVFAALVVAFLALHGGGSGVNVKLSYADLPPLPKNNDFPARYDAQIRAENQAYEREVEDAHQKTSGGT